MTAPRTASAASADFAVGQAGGRTYGVWALPRILYLPIDGFLKRGIDVGAAGILLLLLSPLMAVLALLVALDGGPVFFRHRRVGRDLRPFHCLKFRSMMLGAEPCLSEYLALHPRARDEWSAERKLGCDPRVTAIGRLLRKLSFDELPQLFNVLIGDMSLVGPRPITAEEVGRYGTDAKHYASVRPGLTGPWQVSGRNDVGYAERVMLDAQYARERNVILDLFILSVTPRAVLSQRGAK